VAGFLAQPSLRTVTGMLSGARLAGRRHHDLAYRFFATARWCPDQVGLVLLGLITTTMTPVGAPVVLAVDDTLWRRTGRRLHGATWHHDGNGPARHRPAWGHRWVVVGVVVRLPELIVLAGMTRYRWTPVQVHCYGKLLDREVLAVRCLWYGALKGQPVQVVLSRLQGARDGYELALVSTDLADHRARAPWYQNKRAVSVAGMLASLRRGLLHAQYRHGHLDQHSLDLFPNVLLAQLNPAA
jgi:hypothetical protein